MNQTWNPTLSWRTATIWNSKETEFTFAWDEKDLDGPVAITIAFNGTGLVKTITKPRVEARGTWESLLKMGWTIKETP